jgi:hypothetical protein
VVVSRREGADLDEVMGEDRAALVIAVGGSVFVEKRKGWRQKRRQMRQLNASTLNVRSQPTSPPPS